MDRYRALTLPQYIRFHSSDFFEFIKQFWQIISAIISIALVLYITIDGLVVGLKSVFSILLFICFGALSSCLFFPLATYAHYKRSGEHFTQIEKKVINSSFGVKVKNRQTKSTHRFMGEWEASIQHDVGFTFNNADVFETEHSLFLFPSSSNAVSSYFRNSNYLTPIRFCKNQEEKFHNIYDIYKVYNFERKEKNDKTIISFRDANFKKDVTIILENYPFSATK